ncbi:MAG: efflux RND transporter permease subunit [Bacteroidales bacterium]|nr:efflux RND transporter permease subunit [Bacteroidales bacterium]
MNKLTQFSINYPVTILMIVLAIVLLGFISFGKLGIDLFPDLNSPRIYVEIQSGERPPEEMEERFVDDIEATAIRQKDVVQVTSVSRIGTAQIIIEYKWKKDMDEAFLDLQKALNSFTQNQDIDEMQIMQYDPNADPVMIIGLTHPEITDMNELRKVAENYIRNELVRLDGIAEVELSGQEKREVLVKTDPYRLQSFRLTVDVLSQQLQNFNRNISGGSITEMGMQYVVKGVSMLTSISDFENLIVGYEPVVSETAGLRVIGRAPIYLKDVATISFANKEPANIVTINGQRCIGLSIYKETKYNTIKAVDEVNDALVNLGRALPGYELIFVSDQGRFISAAIREVMNTALIGILLAVFVLFLFLKRIESTLIVSAAIPISIIATFNLMYFNDLTINIMTLGGLALGAGMLVDNAIVVLENIFRNHESGMSLKESAVVGTSQVAGAITASTITTIVVFLPIIYLEGASGELFKDEAWTVAFSLISSLFVAIFVIPMLYHRFYLKRPVPTVKRSIKFTGYGNFLKKVLDRKALVIITATILVAGSLALVPVIGTEFMPRTESRELTVNLKLQEGTKLFRTESTTQNIVSIVNSYFGDEIDLIYSHVGPETSISTNLESVFEGENTSEIRIALNKDSKRTTNDLISVITQLTDSVPGLEITFSQEQTALNTILGTGGSPVVVEVRGEELDQIELITEEVKARMANMEDLYDLQSSIEAGAPEVEVVIDQYRAGIFGLNPSNIITQIQNQLEGQNAGEVEYEGEMNDITIELPERTLNEINELTITSGDQTYRLDEIATISYSVSPKEVRHTNQTRIGRVTAEIANNTSLNKIADKVRENLDGIYLPADYRILVTGEEEMREESMLNLRFALILALVLVYMVLAAQFESLIHPFTIILTIPLAVVGSILVFLLLGKTFNIMALIGIILLVGIAVNNSIILVDRINQLLREGMNRKDAIIMAGQQRIRPIIMTSLTTILALLPLTFGFGESVALRSPMALAVIGGLVTSTLLTLVVIPCVYDVLDRLRGKTSSAEA